MSESYQLGVTQSSPCDYLPDREEKLLIAVDSSLQTSEKYGWLMQQGFRRSGNDIYRPYCRACNACQSLRVLVNDFKPSKSQKRVLKRNQGLSVSVSQVVKNSYYPLYQHYINTIHHDGSMYPATIEQFQGIIKNKITKLHFIEVWHEDVLISVAVTDDIPDALSAVYTFYHPDYKKLGLGVFSILQQIETAVQLNRQFLYLGYQIEGCKKMNYKNRFYPHQILVENQWQSINK